MRRSDFIPENMEKELDIRCDAGNKLHAELTSIIKRHLLESNMTFWEVVGCLDVMKDCFKQRYLSKNDDEEYPEDT